MAFLDELSEREVQQSKAIRGFIIRALVRGANNALLVRQITNFLMAENLIVTPDITKHLQYLMDGGYIEFSGRKANAYNAYRRDEVVRLTKKGVDLVEDTIQDDGVDV